MQMLLALLDEANTGLTIGDGGDDSESEDNKYSRNSRSSALELLKDENDGLSAAASGPRSERMKQTLKIALRLLDVYVSVTLRDANDSLICALIPLLMRRNSTMFQDKNFSHEIRWRATGVLASSISEKPIIDTPGEASDDPAKVSF
ncbi:Uncharacterized protein Rs2_49406 [Raphanus sativus]|nr:Uncharacterized protein Rs2_50187 [Raphanus sativus]KAJ4869047.1 Uncharacterized protein Rs2_49406 [Raphanus sativus]